MPGNFPSLHTSYSHIISQSTIRIYGTGYSVMTESSSDKPVSENMKTVVVHTVQGSIEAEIVQTCLRSYGIESTTQGLAVQSVHPFTVDGMGKIKILVMENEAEAARQIIRDFLESSPESDLDQDP